jgi:ABC-type sugar transport system ATPase subunit
LLRGEGKIAVITGYLGAAEHEQRMDGALEGGITLAREALSSISYLSVAENILLASYCAGRFGFVDRAAMRARAGALPETVHARHIPPDLRADRLSTADQRLVEIPKALTCDLRALIMDDPTSSLTPLEAEGLFDVMRRFAVRGVGVLFISPRFEEVLRIAHRLVVLRDGRVVSDRLAGETARQPAIGDMTCRAFSFERRVARPTQRAQSVLSVRALRDRHRLGPISFALHAGNILGVLGLVGADRTKLLQLLAGLRRTGGGSVALVRWLRIAHDATTGLGARGRLLAGGSQGSRHRPEPVAPREHVAELAPLRPEFDRPGSGKYGRRATDAPPCRVRGPEQRGRTLSGGDQQNAILERCLAVSPRLLLLHEPTRAVDIRTKTEIYDRILAFDNEGIAVIFASSELPEVLALAATVLVLSHGKQRLLTRNEGLDEAGLFSAAFCFEASTVWRRARIARNTISGQSTAD